MVEPTVPDSAALTSIHVRKAVAGEADSIRWIVERLTPLLLAQADYRLGPALRLQVEPADLVDEAWLAVLPKLATLSARDDRMTPVLLKFLSTTMTYRINHLLRRRLTRKETANTGQDVAEVAQPGSGVTTRVARSEMADLVHRHLAALDPADREVIVLRGIEQLPSRVVSVMLDVSPAAIDQRYSRALRRLRSVLKNSVFDELDSHVDGNEPPLRDA